MLARDEKRHRRVMTVAVNVETFHLTAKKLTSWWHQRKRQMLINVRRIYSLGTAIAGTKQFLPVHLPQNETF